MAKLLVGVIAFVLSTVLVPAQYHEENEVGFVFSATGFEGDSEAGVGGRFLHNYTPRYGFEFQGTFYPINEAVNLYQGSLHWKGTYRMEERHKVNFFGVFGPGFLVTDSKFAGKSSRFAVNVGGGVEAVPHPNIAVRADLTDFVFFADGDPFNNFDFKLALMYRW